MKYFINLLEDFKAGNFAPVYLFYGPEGYLRREAINKIRSFLLDGECCEFNYTEADGEETTLEDIVSLASMTPFFSGRRLVVVRNAKFFTGKKSDTGSREAGQAANTEEPGTTATNELPLLKYIAHPNPSTCLVFDAGNQVDKRKKIFKETARVGKAIEFTLLKKEELTKWLEQHARLADKSLAPGTAAGILAKRGNNLEALSVELHKLIAYAGDSRVITPEDVTAVTPVHPEEDIFAVVDAIGERNPSRAIEGIHRLVRQKQPPPYILVMVARQIRLLLQVGEALRAGEKAAGLTARLGIHPYTARKIVAQQNNFDRQQLIKYLHGLHQLDVAVKTGKQEFLPGIEMLIMDNSRKKGDRYR